MTARPEHTAADAARALRDISRDPAASAYWAWLKRTREAQAKAATA